MRCTGTFLERKVLAIFGWKYIRESVPDPKHDRGKRFDVLLISRKKATYSLERIQLDMADGEFVMYWRYHDKKHV